jgi:hypothetical protein
MTESSPRPLHIGDPADAAPSSDDPSLDSLREILFGRYRRQIAELEAELDELERRVTDEETLAAIIAPVMGDAIRRKIRDARDEMVEALYPVIGQAVVRAVSEAIRDLARSVDAQMRTSLGPRAVWRRLRGRVRGVSSADMALRDALPFKVTEVFLIHRETGLLLWHVSSDQGEREASSDSDLISGMLTAIRDFAQDAFGRGEEGQLDEIQYGDWRILIEASQHAYVAVVVDGIEPSGFRAEVRERLIEVEHAYGKTLRRYDGDPTPLSPVEASLNSLMAATQVRGLSPAQRGVLVGVVGLAVICLATVCLAGRWGWRAVHATPTPVLIEPTPTFTVTPSPTPTATPSPTVIPSPTPTATPLPTLTAIPTATPTAAPMVGLMTGNVWLRGGPSADSPRVGMILERGQSVEILAVFGDWYHIRWTPQAGTEVAGWVPAEWVGTTAPIPAWMITPTPGS